MVKKIEQTFEVENITIKLASSGTKEVKLTDDDDDISLTIKGNITTELMEALGKHLLDEHAEIKVNFSIPDKSQTSVEDFS